MISYNVTYHVDWNNRLPPFDGLVGYWIMTTSAPGTLSMNTFIAKPTARQIRKEVKRVKKFGRDFLNSVGE